MIGKEEIKSFIEGRNPEKYIIAIEGDRSTNYVDVFYNDPEKGKYMVRDKYKPFLWANIDILSKLYGGNRNVIKDKCKQYGITIKKLITEDVNGFEPERLRNGYKFIVQTKKSFYDISNFFKYGGVNIYGSKDVVTLSPEEQYMIQTSKRLFKGMDSYDDVLRLQYDIETTGLSAKSDYTYAIGCKTNKGFEKIFRLGDYDLDTLEEKESLMYIDFFQTLRDINPDIIGTYNGEFFDWVFILERFEILGLDKDLVVKTLSEDKPICRYKSTLKLGQETENFLQTKMYGTNIIDISHSVKKAKAINSEIKGWSLKYITKYAELNKENRVYINGNNIHKTYISEESHALNEQNGDWYVITDKTPLKEGYDVVTGRYIADRYLLDDIYETECVDFHFNQAAFLVSKLTPTTYTRSITMGSASLWKLILCAWSYENGLAVPEYQPKQKFTGGLSRLLETGFAENVAKLDYAALYPNIELTWDIFPDLDITSVMKGMLLYIAETRDEYKELKNHYTSIGDKKIASFYDTQQLPLKILANSFFGAFGAPYIFNWGDVNCAEETTCRGRQYLRLMVSHFHEKYKFKPLVGDSVTKDTWVYIKYHKNKQVSILPIEKIFDDNSEGLIIVENQHRDFNNKDYDVLTRNGWKGINYVYRHKTNKPIYEISTNNRYTVRVTEDHSVFSNGVKVLPSSLLIGCVVDLYGGKSDTVIGNTICDDYDDYVYDISTHDGSFIGGKGMLCLSNTDGFNFAIPKEVDEIEYLCQGMHRLTEKNKGKLLKGLDAVVADFNERYMLGRMGLDIDDICTETINFTRKNYANNILKFGKDGSTYVKMKMVGNTLKSGSLPKFIEEFINKGVKYLMSKQPKEFVDLYYSIVDDLYSYKIPVAKLASKSKVKLSKEEYLKYIKGVNKAGNNMSRQAHMELVLKEDLNVGLGDTIYYYNIGKTKSVSDIKNDKKNNVIIFNCELVSNDIIEYNPDHIETNYNIPKYIDMLNTKLKTLLVVFSKDVREKLPVKVSKDKKTKEYVLSEKYIFTDEDLSLISGVPIEDVNQDTYDDMMVMEDKEVKFWLKVDKIPNNICENVYKERVVLYNNTMLDRKITIFNEYTEKLNEVKLSLSAKDYQDLTVNGVIPKKITNHFNINEETLDLYIDDYFLGHIIIGNLSEL